MEERLTAKAHKIVINDRNGGSITGVVDVISFDTKEILLMTELGVLMIKGEELHVKRLSVEKGEADISGKIDSLVYSEMKTAAETAGNLIGRLFK
ncbi:MAG: sporulation protein YabP [Lachnospiraceae bacterium]|nr:sporulation protein YabP [Lachnospiraceae bacterium]